MKTIRVYFLRCIGDQKISPQQETITLKPKIPETVNDGDYKTKRICCALTIHQCLLSLQIPDFDYNRKDIYKKSLPVFFEVYTADVPVKNIKQPTNKKVFDGWKTGELWITKKQKFNLLGLYELRKQKELPTCGYSRFIFTKVGMDYVNFVLRDQVIYGNEDAFSFIAMDPSRPCYYKEEVDLL